MSKSQSHGKCQAYLLGGVVTAVFFIFIFAVLLLFAPVPSSYLYLEIFFLLPLSPLFAVWLYFLFKAVVPITGGMPGKGSRQWFLSYLFALSILIYLIGVAVILDLLFPFVDKDYTEMIFPSTITAVTLFIVLRIPKVNRFMWRVFEPDQKKNGASAES